MSPKYIGVFVLIALAAAALIYAAVLRQDDEDTTAPTFESARTNDAGTEVILTFSEDIGPPAIVSVLASQYNIPLSLFYRAVISVSIDGYPNLATGASLDGNELTLRIETPSISHGQAVKVSYDNVFAKNAPGLFVDDAGDVLASFGEQNVTNNTRGAASTFVQGPVISTTELTIDEGGTDTVNVRLPSEPEETTTVDVYAAIGSLDISPESITFTTDNWDTDQSVTVTGREDDDTHTNWDVVVVRIKGVSLASSYDTFVRVVIEDDDEEEILVAGGG